MNIGRIIFGLLLSVCVLSTPARAQSVTITKLSTSCDTIGLVTASFSGSYTPPLVFTWYLPYGVVNDTVYTYNDTIRNFFGGAISVYVYADSPYTFVAEAAATYTPGFSVSVANDTVLCPLSVGSLMAVPSGGTPPYQYYWCSYLHGIDSVYSYSNPGVLPLGLYLEKIIDATGCEVITSYNAEVSQDPGYSVGLSMLLFDTVTVIPLNYFNYLGLPYFGNAISDFCPYNDTTFLNISGGHRPFSYSWSPSSVILLGSGDTVLLPYMFGSLQVTVTDSIGCQTIGTFDVIPTSDMTLSMNVTTASCTNGSAAAVVSGGYRPFSYLWNTGATSDSISGLVTGSYTVTVLDAAGCTNSVAGIVPQSITINPNLVATPATCTGSDGVVTSFPSGGVPPYGFVWTNGGTTASITGLSAGNYGVNVMDVNGCIGGGNTTVSTSTPITVSYSVTPSSCLSATGTVTLLISGGIAPYHVTWYTASGDTGSYVTGLPAGSFAFSISDSAGCLQHGEVVIPSIETISLSLAASPASCTAANGSLTVTATGGVSPYSYSWSSGSSTTNVLNGVISGIYTSTVTDSNGCKSSNCYFVPTVSPLLLGVNTTEASCLYVDDGTITLTASLGTPPYVYSMGGTSSGPVTITGVAEGHYFETVTDSMGCSTWQWATVGYNSSDSSCFCVLKGNLFYDSITDCIREPSERGIDNIQINCVPFGYTYSDTGGNYYFLLPTGSYTVSETVLGYYPLSSCQNNAVPITVSAASGCVVSQNFADTVYPIHDMSINSWDDNFAIPGDTYLQALLITNNGTQTESNILSSYTPDGQLYTPTFVPSGIFSGAPYYYSTLSGPYTLAPGASTLFINSYNVPTNIPLGTAVVFKDSIAYQSPMSNWLTDYSPWNNVDYFTTIVRAAFDPNFKEVSPVGLGPEGLISTDDSVLTYMVHFQNTGDYMAQNVVVIDTLDSNLDWQTLRPLYLQYSGRVSMDTEGHVKFTFNNIDLAPAAADSVASSAMFSYVVKLKHGLVPRSTIKNRASIYFDDNAPILTNQTLNTIKSTDEIQPTGVATENSIMIFPNPANNTCFVVVDNNEPGNGNLTVTDITGNIVYQNKVALTKGKQFISINISGFNSGIYIVSLVGGNAVHNVKLIKLER